MQTHPKDYTRISTASQPFYCCIPMTAHELRLGTGTRAPSKQADKVLMWCKKANIFVKGAVPRGKKKYEAAR